jgi:hypothetical protein
MTDTGNNGVPVRRPRLPDPGWLPDPSRLDIERYWTGTSWTSRTRDRVSKLERIPVGERTDAPRRERRPGRWIAFLSVIAVVAVAGLGYAGALPSWVPGAAQFTLGTPAGPDVDYPVFGSDDTVTYLARSMIAQEQEIDLTYLLASGRSVEDVVEDAMKEALTQNPYVFVSAWNVSIAPARVRLLPQYLYSAEEAQRRRVETAAAVDAIVAIPAVQSAADTRAKVAALHDAVLMAATYDFGAYQEIGAGATTEGSPQVAQSQEAYGILVAGTAVCTGYAQAFQLLAQASGLNAVVVTGTASSGFTTGGHAWDRVLVDGEWLVVDATWDDADDAQLGRDYLLLDPLDSKLSTRTADSDWVVDANLRMFGS